MCNPTPLRDCLCHVSFSRHSPLTLEIVEKDHGHVKVFCPNFSRDRRPQLFYGRLLAQPTVHRLVELFADLRLRSMAMMWNAEFTEGG